MTTRGTEMTQETPREADLRLYIWEDSGISSGYHDDGTLVVLAASPEEARELAYASAAYEGEDYYDRRDIWRDGLDYGSDYTNRAIEREPDRVIELTAPCVVAFNGGGYD